MEHRKKVKHYDREGDAHLLTFSCYRRLPLLSRDRTRQWLLDSLEKARQKHGFDLWAWVVMPEHVHLLIWPRQEETKTDKILASVKKPVGYKAIHNAVEYIHANPVRRDLAAEPTDWSWSSARDWAGLEHPHLTVDQTLPVLHPDGQ